jgi:MSHA biogenesis protein MshO
MHTAISHYSKRARQQGFTLVELIMVIVIMGVIGGMVSVFMRSPIDAYFSTARRASLADAADSTLRRMSRDIRKALPNSIVVAGDAKCVDFIPTKTGGRYRADNTSAGLDFGSADTSFNMLGSNPTDVDQTIQTGDVVVVYNQGITGSDAYANPSDTTAVITGVAAAVGANPAETTIGIASKLFPLASPGNRFQVVPATERVVSYACTAQGTLVRAVNTASFAKNCQTSGTITASGTVRVSVLAQKVDQGACSFVYDSNAQRDGLLRLRLQMTDSGETVSLQHQIHVDNTP